MNESENNRLSAVRETSERFWDAMRRSDVSAMHAIADPACRFVHIGVTCGLEEEAAAFADGVFRPTDITINNQEARLCGPADSTAVIITDCNYTLLLNGEETTHHFAVTEVYVPGDGEAWKLVQFSFCALVY